MTTMHHHRLSTFILLCVLFAIPLSKAHYGVTYPSKNATGESKTGCDDMTALQKHVSFFDRNKDGIITVKETYQGLRAIGVGYVAAVTGAAGINGALSPLTRPSGKSPSASLPIYIENISKGKHGSDTDTYDSEGRFVPEKFEEIFTKYAKTKPNALTSQELDNLREGNKDQGDIKGQAGSKAEWTLLFQLAKDKDGFLYKDTVRGVYDGSLFYKLEQARSSSNKKP